MQPVAPDARLRHMTRLLLGGALAFGLSLVPIATVQACSCAMPGSPAETVAASDLAFVGTVVDVAPAPAGANGGGQLVRYAWEVERASAPTAAIVEVRALGGDGGAACGMTFGLGERWFVAAYRDGEALQTGLCSGNLSIEGMGAADLDAVTAALPVEPAPDPDSSPVEEAEADRLPLLPAAIGAAAALAIAAVLVVEFRDRPGRPR